MRDAAMLTSQIRVGGSNSRNPMVSVKKPGVSKKAPATTSAIPSSISRAGSSFSCNLRCARVRVDSPCILSNQTPITAVSTTSRIVQPAPITWPTWISR